MRASARFADVILSAVALFAGAWGAHVREQIATWEAQSLHTSDKALDMEQDLNSINRDSIPVIEDTHGGILQTPKKRCALVGSSKGLVGLRRGAEIDDHDLVVRINRLPTKRFFEDFGKRTDVLFSNRAASDGNIAVMDGASIEGSLNCRQGGPGCNFGSIVFKKFSKYLTSWLDAPFVIGTAHKDVWRTATSLLRNEHTPSTGFIAFVTYAALCQEMHLYGFVGNATADGHKVEKKHAYDLEHSIMRHIAAGPAVGTSARTMWAQSIDGRSQDAIRWFEDHVGKSLSVKLFE